MHNSLLLNTNATTLDETQCKSAIKWYVIVGKVYSENLKQVSQETEW